MIRLPLPPARTYLGQCLVLVVLFAAGCGSRDSGQQAKVTGIVTVGGQPLADAEVQFVPKSDSALGVHTTTTNQQGEFVIKTDGSNAPLRPGEYVVLIRKMATRGNDASLPGGGMGATKNELPEAYSNPKKSPFQVEVKPGTQTIPPFDINLAKHS